MLEVLVEEFVIFLYSRLQRENRHVYGQLTIHQEKQHYGQKMELMIKLNKHIGNITGIISDVCANV